LGGEIGDPLPVERGMASAEQLQVVQPHETDEAVARRVSGEIDEFFLRRRHQNRQAVAEVERLRTRQQHLRGELDPESCIRAKVKLDRWFSGPRQIDVMPVLQNVIGCRPRLGCVPGLGQDVQRCLQVLRFDQ